MIGTRNWIRKLDLPITKASYAGLRHQCLPMPVELGGKQECGGPRSATTQDLARPGSRRALVKLFDPLPLAVPLAAVAAMDVRDRPGGEARTMFTSAAVCHTSGIVLHASSRVAVQHCCLDDRGMGWWFTSHVPTGAGTTIQRCLLSLSCPLFPYRSAGGRWSTRASPLPQCEAQGTW